MILITGGTGVMGQRLIARFRKAGHGVRVLALPGDPAIAAVAQAFPEVEIREGNVGTAKSLNKVCDGIETVFHLAAVILTPDETLFERINTVGTGNMVLRASSAGVKHFIHVSSASVVYPRPTAYSLSKRKAEEIVESSGLNWTIVRPTLVYDKGRGGQEFDLFLDYLRRFPVLPFIGAGKAKKRPVYVEDIVDGLAKLPGNSRAFGKRYNFSGAESIFMVDFARLCLRLLGKENKKVVHLPVGLCTAAAMVLKRVMKNPPLRWPVIAGVTQDADLDPALAMEELGYAPRAVSEMLPGCFPRDS